MTLPPVLYVISIYLQGLYVFETPYGHTVVGPTNVRQESRSDRSVAPGSQQELLEHCHALFPASRAWTPVGLYAGLRPATQHQAFTWHLVKKTESFTCEGFGYSVILHLCSVPT